MKKILKILIPLIFILAIGFMVYKISVKIIQKEIITEQIQTLPPFAFKNIIDGKDFTNAQLDNEKPVLITYFHPECEYCQEQASLINQQLDSFSNYVLLMVSYADSAVIKIFSEKYSLAGYQNIVFLEDKDLIFKEIFGETAVPNSFIYNKQGKLVKQMKGEAKIEELLKYLNE
jgi:thiol-disulfide isomerase/thioredoxin